MVFRVGFDFVLTMVYRRFRRDRFGRAPGIFIEMTNISVGFPWQNADFVRECCSFRG